jgi:hypothetical protein
MTVCMVGAGLVGTGVQLLGAGGVLSRSAGASAMGLRPISASTSPAQSNRTGSCSTGSTVVRFGGDGAGSTGMGSVGAVLVSTVLVGSTAMSPGSRLMGEAGAALVCVVRTGSTVMLPWTELTGLGCMASCATGSRLGASPTSAAPSNRAGSGSTVSNTGRAVGDGAGSRTSSCILSCSPVFAPRRSASRSLVLTCFSTPLSSSSLSVFPSSFSSLLCCLSSFPPSVLPSFSLLSDRFVLRCSTVVGVTTTVSPVVVPLLVSVAVVGAGDGIGASVAVSDSKAAIESEFRVWATGVEVLTSDGDGVGIEVGAGVGIRATVGTGAEVGIKIDAGVVTGVVESKTAGVIGWTLNCVGTGVRKTVP